MDVSQYLAGIEAGNGMGSNQARHDKLRGCSRDSCHIPKSDGGSSREVHTCFFLFA